MSNKERAIELLNQIPESKMFYVLAFLEGVSIPDETPNAETIAAFEELENGGGECFNSLGDLWKSLEE